MSTSAPWHGASRTMPRRRLLRWGGAALVGAVAGFPATARAAAAAEAAAGDPWLRRATHARRVGEHYTVRTATGPVTVRLEEVGDLRGRAAGGRSLGASEDAFVLVFAGTGAAPIDQGVHHVVHPVAGSFAALVVPGRPRGADTRYLVVVNRA